MVDNYDGSTVNCYICHYNEPCFKKKLFINTPDVTAIRGCEPLPGKQDLLHKHILLEAIAKASKFIDQMVI